MEDKKVQIKKLLNRLKYVGISVGVLAFAVAYTVHKNSEDVRSVFSSGLDQSRPVIVIDPGHGGEDGGCISIDGTPEKGINLSISLEFADMMRVFGYDVVMTRSEDKAIYDSGVTGISKQKLSDMKNRLAIINKTENTIAVSVHQNQYTDSKYSGAQMFYSGTNPLSQQLAQTVQDKFKNNLQPENQREIKLVTDELYLLVNSHCPAIMCECGFLSNKQESAMLESEQYQKEVAFTIFSGVTEFETSVNS